MQITVIRTRYTEKSTSGIMLVNDIYFGFTLEDRLRNGPKIPNETCIAAGEYDLIVSHSTRFNRDLPEILKVANFTGVRIHGGNTDKDTEGCILVAANRINDDLIQGSKSEALVTLLKDKNEPHKICIVNAWLSNMKG